MLSFVNYKWISSLHCKIILSNVWFCKQNIPRSPCMTMFF